ncbi:MAG: Hsp20/alpha crystallin family protein [Bacteroidota bacterium]
MTLLKVSNQKPVRSIFDDVFFNAPFSNALDYSFKQNANLPAVNILESEKDFKIEFNAPGFAKENFKIELEKNLLNVSAEHSSENSSENKNYTRKEFSFSSFKRSFNLPESVNTEAIDAKYENGILRLVLPKKEEQLTKVSKEIKIS